MADAGIIVSDNPAEDRYEVFVDGHLGGYTAYRSADGRIVFTHTTVAPDYGGQGVGSALARAVLDDARGRHLTVVPRCPFIAAYIERHPQYRDLVGE